MRTEQYLRRKGIETASKYFLSRSRRGGTQYFAGNGRSLPSALGIDAGSSLGLGDMLFRFPGEQFRPLFDLVGPGGGIVDGSR